MTKNWCLMKLGEVCEFQNGFAFKSKLFTDEGLPILRISNIQQDKISHNRLVFFKKESYDIDFEKYKVQKGALVIAMSGATTGKLAVSNVDEIFYLNQRVGKFEPKENLSKKFLYYFLMNRIEENLKISLGSAQPNLSTEQIKNFSISVPPIPEQKRIVKILDKAFTAINKAKANAEKNLQNSRELFDSYLNKVFAPSASSWQRNTGEDWEEKRLGEVLSIERGGSPRPIKKYLTNSSDGINWIKISDATASEKYIYETKEKITRDGLHKTRVVNEGDFILSNSMSFGRPYIMKTTGCIHDGWLVFKQNGKKLFETEFLYYLLSSTYVFQQFNYLAAGSTVRNLNIALVSSVRVPIPPLPEQKRIVSKLDVLSTETKRLEKIYQQKLADLEELKKSILQKAFDGEL